MISSSRRLAGLGALIAFLWGCSELPLQPTKLSDQLTLYALLNPDSTRHLVNVAPVDASTTLRLAEVKAIIHKRDPTTKGWTLVAEWDSSRAAAAGGPFYGEECNSWVPDEWPVSLGPNVVGSYHEVGRYCLRPEFVLEPGATYRIEVKAAGRTPAVGETRVVGGFEIERATLSSTAGSHSLDATWSESTAAHLYFVGMRRRFDVCVNCDEAWYAQVEGTQFQGRVPKKAVDIAGPTPMLDMLAVDRHFHAFLTTGDGGNLHEVHPVQNVVGGYGVVGSYLHRSRKIETGGGSAARPAGPD